MNVLMLGWEFPPYISGGLGTACFGLTKGLSELGTKVVFILPHEIKAGPSAHVTLVGAQSGKPGEAAYFNAGELRNVQLRAVNIGMNPYARPGEEIMPVGEVGRQFTLAGGQFGAWPTELVRATTESPAAGRPGNLYAGDLFQTVASYCKSVGRIAGQEKFDVVHAHDWMTFAAGAVAAAVSGKPLVVHVHSTEFDRNGDHVDQRIYDIERQGMHVADRVITVSQFTRRVCIDRYGVPPEKVSVVYNAVCPNCKGTGPRPDGLEQDDKIVLFLGRITMQKGPEYFLAAAKKVLERVENVKFIMAGTGNLLRQTIEMAASLGIGHRVLFTGFLCGEDVARAFHLADLYVMPSVSEPFGITPLEALTHNVPVLISRQSGVSEVLRHALKVDFWDVDEMANKMIAVLTRTPLRNALRDNGAAEVRKFDWTVAARQCNDIYGQVAGRHN